jgi:hypothetical protein
MRQIWEHLIALFDPKWIQRVCVAPWDSTARAAAAGERPMERCETPQRGKTMMSIFKLFSKESGLTKPTTVHFVGGSSITGVVNYAPLQGGGTSWELKDFLARYNFTHGGFMEPHPPCFFEGKICTPEGSGPGRAVSNRALTPTEVLQACNLRAVFAVVFGQQRWVHVHSFSGLWGKVKKSRMGSMGLDPEACGAVGRNDTSTGNSHLVIPSNDLIQSYGRPCYCGGRGKDCWGGSPNATGHAAHHHSPSRGIYAIAERLWAWALL